MKIGKVRPTSHRGRPRWKQSDLGALQEYRYWRPHVSAAMEWFTGLVCCFFFCYRWPGEMVFLLSHILCQVPLSCPRNGTAACIFVSSPIYCRLIENGFRTVGSAIFNPAITTRTILCVPLVPHSVASLIYSLRRWWWRWSWCCFYCCQLALNPQRSLLSRIVLNYIIIGKCLARRDPSA